jgi:hypothetical protein
MKIYIAASFKNLHAVHLLQNALEERRHTVFDWTKLQPPLPESMSVEERRKELDTDERGEIYTYCSGACGMVDLVIYLGPAGQDAACEVGIATYSGVTVWGLQGPLEAPGLILKRAVHRWFTSVGEMLNAIDAGELELCENFSG